MINIIKNNSTAENKNLTDFFDSLLKKLFNFIE